MIQDKLIEGKRITSEEAIKILENSGEYKVVPLHKSGKNITNDQVVKRFYDKLNETIGAEYYLSLSLDKEKDFTALREFQKKAKECGMSRFLANEKVCLMIDLVFKYYEELELHTPPNSLYYLLSKSGRWIIQKAVVLHQKFKKEYEYSEEYREYVDTLCNVRSDKVDTIIKDRHAALKKLYKDIRSIKDVKKEEKS